MRFPAYLLLPISGAVLLVAAVLGSWLWPAPTVPTPSFTPPALPAQAAVEPPPAPEPVRAPPRPAAHPAPARPVQPVEKPVERPMNAAAMPPPIPPPVFIPPPPAQPPQMGGPTPASQWAEMTPEAREAMRSKWRSLPDRVGDLAWRGIETMERQRDEARNRGDQVEAERLDGLIRQGRENLERMKAMRQQQPPPGAQAGPPTQ